MNGKIVAIGGAGINIASGLVKKGFNVIAMDVDPSKIAHCTIPNKICLFPPKEWVEAQKITPPIHHIDSYIEQALAHEACKIEAILDGLEEMHILTGLGGRTGSILPHRVATIAGEMGIRVKATVTLPSFKENIKRRELAVKSFNKLQSACDSCTMYLIAEQFETANHAVSVLFSDSEV